MQVILIVEDEETVRRGINLMLEAEGYKTLEAADGAEALTVLEYTVPSLIISDITMPVMDGLTFYNEVQKKKNLALIPFIFLTAKVTSTDIRNGMNLGADDYITKPFRMEDLLSSVKRRLKKNEVIDGFVTEVLHYLSHELRTPLTAIQGFSDIMREGELHTKEEYIEFSNAINRSSKRLSHQFEKFLTFSSVEKDMFLNYGDKKFHPVLIKMFVLDIEETAANYRRREDLNISFEDARLLISEEHLKLLLSELTVNASVYSPPGSKIDITGTRKNDFYKISFTNKRNEKTLKSNSHLFSSGIIMIQKLTSFYGGEFTIQPGNKFITTILKLKLACDKARE